MFDFTNARVIVTGATSGIGKAIARAFYQAGARVAICGRKNLEAAIEEIAGEDRSHLLACLVDLSDLSQLEAFFAKTVETFGGIDILVNNAGITRDAMFHKMTDQQARMVLDVNFYGTFYCCQAVIAGMREREDGKIINISSTSAFGNIGQTNYAASKAAIDGFTRTLALESARKNITVNSIAPGMIETDILKTIPEDIMKMKIASVPANRVGQPSEIASVASFLASDDSSWVTGNCILACGGMKMRG